MKNITWVYVVSALLELSIIGVKLWKGVPMYPFFDSVRLLVWISLAFVTYRTTKVQGMTIMSQVLLIDSQKEQLEISERREYLLRAGVAVR